MMFLGQKAHQIASVANNPKYRRQYIKKVSNKIKVRIDKLDTTMDHKRSIMGLLECFDSALSKDNTSKMICILLRLCGSLLGFKRGAVLRMLVYWQDNNQYYSERMLQGGDPLEDYCDKKNAISIRTKIIKDLKADGINTFKIALILNTTEYEIKKYLSSKKT